MNLVHIEMENKLSDASNLFIKYATAVDRDSAFEFLQRKAIEDAKAAEAAKEEAL